MQKITQKQQVLLILLSLAVIAGLFTAGSKKVEQEPTPIEQTPGEETVTWASTIVRDETIDESDSNRKITAAYPVTKSESVNAYFKQYVDEQVRQFKNDTEWVNDAEIDSASEGSLSLDISYKQERSIHADNFIFTLTSYTGGAHDLSVTKTFSFSSEGKLIQPADIFTNGLSGLKTIAIYVQGDLTKRNVSDKKWITEGSAPTADNYGNIIITDTGLTVIFDAYQVAPYAAGRQTVAVPLSVFKGIATPEYFTR